MSNHLRNIRALLENAKEFKVSRKVDTYEYESLEKNILEDNIRYSEVMEIFTDVVYREWFYNRNFADKEMVITRYSDL
jgi:1,2-phenylacetyl-CoA epoxidase catalytic subunit|tara:strand:+ start:312 stop:545 length:234 start_codon:yes stop_codon:yes gene_type:complete